MDGWLSFARTYVVPALQVGCLYLLGLPLFVKIAIALGVVAIVMLRRCVADMRLRALMRQYRSGAHGPNRVGIGILVALGLGAIAIWRFAHI